MASSERSCKNVPNFEVQFNDKSTLPHADPILAHAVQEGVAFFTNSCCDEHPRR